MPLLRIEGGREEESMLLLRVEGWSEGGFYAFTENDWKKGRFMPLQRVEGRSEGRFMLLLRVKGGRVYAVTESGRRERRFMPLPRVEGGLTESKGGGETGPL